MHKKSILQHPLVSRKEETVMPHIQVLDQITIDKIAAGEVIERPASIVKELVENAIDAKAASVTVEIQDGGISFIRIADNGSGIVREDVHNAFLRHSTSKIRSVEDLTLISSLGFRGEALSSIAAVTQVELITKTKEDTFGTRYVIEGGKEQSLDDTGAPNGTTFLIRQLFYNVPARRKFLKTPMTEAGHIQDLLMRLALSHPEVSFQFINNNQEKLRTSGNGKLKDVIYSIYGREVAASLIDIDYEKNGMRISGYLGKPAISRGNRNFENFFVNGRYVKSSMISKSVEDAYKDFVMQHKFPFVVLHFQISGEDIDVNVHPTKMELRFQKQQEVYSTIYEAIHRTLLEPELIPVVELPDSPKQEEPVPTASDSPFLLKPKARTEVRPLSQDVSVTELISAPEQISAAKQIPVAEPTFAPTQILESARDTVASVQNIEVNKDEDYFLKKMQERVFSYYNCRPQKEEPEANTILPLETSSPQDEVEPSETISIQEDLIPPEIIYSVASDSFSTDAPSEKQFLLKERGDYVVHMPEPKTEQLNLFDEKLLRREIKAEYKLIGQLFSTYWLVQFNDSLYIIDQHAAHERVLYERTLKNMKNREFTSQYISPPIILSLSMQEVELLKEHLERFQRIGFEIEPFGGDEYAVRAVPDNLFSIAKKELLMEMLDGLTEGISTSMTPALIDEKVASLSCKAAVKGNNRLSAMEVDSLIGELLGLENPYHCPHGRPTIIAMTKKELEKKFKRIL